MKLVSFIVFFLGIVSGIAFAQTYWPYNSLAYPVQRGTHVGQGYVIGATDAATDGSIAIGGSNLDKKAIILDAINAAIIGEGTNSTSGSLQFMDKSVPLIYLDSADDTVPANYSAVVGGCLLIGKVGGSPEIWISNNSGTNWNRVGESTISAGSLTAVSFASASAGDALSIDGSAFNVDDAAANTRGAIYLPNIVQSVKTGAQQNASAGNTNRVDITDLSVTITPKSVTSKIRVTATIYGCNGSANHSVYLFLQRDGEDIVVGDADGSKQQATAVLGDFDDTVRSVDCASIDYIDSPASISAVTYKVQMNSLAGTLMNINRNSSETDSSVSARFVSVITAEEIYQ